jgi:uncharacterized protein YndB with AHSA1/START domain
MDELKITTEFDVPPEQVYKAWLSSKLHSEMTGVACEISAKVGGKFRAGDGYIEGVTVELEPNRRIVQKWRSKDFPADAPDSTVEILLFPIDDDGCLFQLFHTGLPAGDGDDYLEGWEEHYLEPMREFFGEFEY